MDATSLEGAAERADARNKQGECYPIGTVASLTGVRAMTLRAWERRYGLIEPVRTTSGHRLYSRADIDLINEIVALLDKGMRIGQVGDELERLRVNSNREPDLWDDYRRSMVSAVIRFDERGLDDIYNEALSLYPINVVTRHLLVPLLAELGQRWESARGSIAEEHFFAFYLRNKLGARFHHRSPNAHGPRLLMACLPGEHHEIGLLLFALAAHDAGFRLVVLGADLPLSEIPAVVRKAECDAVVLSGMVAPDDGLLDDDLPALVDELDVAVLIGGDASVQSCDDLLHAGVQPLGQDIATALRRLDEILAGSDEAPNDTEVN